MGNHFYTLYLVFRPFIQIAMVVVMTNKVNNINNKVKNKTNNVDNNDNKVNNNNNNKVDLRPLDP